MSLQFVKASTSDALTLNGILKELLTAMFRSEHLQQVDLLDICLCLIIPRWPDQITCTS